MSSFFLTGNDLLSQDPTVQVPSTLKGLTAVFGMGTGGSPSPLSPDGLNIFNIFNFLNQSSKDKQSIS